MVNYKVLLTEIGHFPVMYIIYFYRKKLAYSTFAISK